ncbi:hypothetical protein [Mycobacterium sp. DL592]|uniref:hypothetical protein n=1 Tax=Mycobacterium sp. DL592 TaxID=2675524 RepID=UPI001AAFEBA5|nr:hypothetical protein [Mycobacterium sp. DL592]
MSPNIDRPAVLSVGISALILFGFSLHPLAGADTASSPGVPCGSIIEQFTASPETLPEMLGNAIPAATPDSSALAPAPLAAAVPAPAPAAVPAAAPAPAAAMPVAAAPAVSYTHTTQPTNRRV